MVDPRVSTPYQLIPQVLVDAESNIRRCQEVRHGGEARKRHSLRAGPSLIQGCLAIVTSDIIPTANKNDRCMFPQTPGGRACHRSKSQSHLPAVNAGVNKKRRQVPGRGVPARVPKNTPDVSWIAPPEGFLIHVDSSPKAPPHVLDLSTRRFRGPCGS